MKDAGGSLYSDVPRVKPFEYKGLRVGFFHGPRSVETLFQANTLRPVVRVLLSGTWCALEIQKSDAYYRYSIKVDGRAYFSRYVLVQGDAAEMLTLQQATELKKTKGEFALAALPVGLEGLATYLDALVEHKVKKEQLLDGVENDIITRLQTAGLREIFV